MATLTGEESIRRSFLMREKNLDELLLNWKGRSHLASKQLQETISLVQRDEKVNKNKKKKKKKNNINQILFLLGVAEDGHWARMPCIDSFVS
jgi:hypothetical protein